MLGAMVLDLAAGLGGTPAFAKCTKDCKHSIAANYKTCKSACAKGAAGKACKKTCKDSKKTAITACKAAANPSPPSCSPSGAFLN